MGHSGFVYHIALFPLRMRCSILVVIGAEPRHIDRTLRTGRLRLRRGALGADPPGCRVVHRRRESNQRGTVRVVAPCSETHPTS